MGDINQLHFVKAHRAELCGPYLEVGSRDYGSTQDLRTLFPGETYVRVDMSEGEAVDRVIDLTLPFDQINASLEGLRFGTIFCLSVMEHCDQPFRMAENLTHLVAPGGKLVVSVPFAWKFHGYPSDYWRFTHEGVKKLFPELEFPGHLGNAMTSRPGKHLPLDESTGLIYLSGGHQRRTGRYLRGVAADVLKFTGRLGFLRWLVGYRYLLAPTMINMIGVRRSP
ncbi:MAG: class I SAM-dependent methyltransferase [Planctomycetota bacterium]|jgi:SAM-dependent methyltransferase